MDNYITSKFRQVFGLQNVKFIQPSGINIDNISVISNLNVPSISTFYNICTVLSNINISDTILLYNNIVNNNIINVNHIYLNRLTATNIYVSSISNINNELNVNNITVHNSIINNMTVKSNLTVNGNGLFNTLSLNNLNVNNTLYTENLTVSSSFYINGLSLLNNVTVNNTLYVSSNTLLNSNCTINTSIITTNIITNNITEYNNLICGNLISQNIVFNNVTCTSSLHGISNVYTNIIDIIDQIVMILPEYLNNDIALSNNAKVGTLYRTGGIIKICINPITPMMVLQGETNVTILSNTEFIDPGVSITSNLIINVIQQGTVSTQKTGTYIRYYNGVDKYNNIINSLMRIIQVV